MHHRRTAMPAARRSFLGKTASPPMSDLRTLPKRALSGGVLLPLLLAGLGAAAAVAALPALAAGVTSATGADTTADSATTQASARAGAAPGGHVEAGAMANPAASYELPTIEVISTAPLPGMGVPLDQIPSNVQTLGSKALQGRGFDNLSDAINGALGSVNVNDTQGNPFQMDVNVRGFTASPSLGTPQGVSVFVDGVRVNETFGDVVNWDLIPQNAIANVTLMPGANPQFGLNTLGGALSVVTKSGFQFPGTKVELTEGSSRRHQFALESGGHGESVDWFVAANVFKDRGWGDHNPSTVRQLFGKTGYQDDDTDIDLAVTLASNRLQGNQTLPLSFLGNPRQIYTYPDEVDNRLAMLNLKGSQYLAHDLLMAGSVYSRRVDTAVFNSNVNNNYDTQLDANGNPCAGQVAFLPDCPNAQNIYNTISQRTAGAALQLSLTAALDGHANTAIAGISLDHGRTDFQQGQQDALVAADRSTFSSQPVLPSSIVHGGADYTGLYATDTYSLSDPLTLTLAARYNRARVRTTFDYPVTASSGDFTYARLNPALGLNYAPHRDITTFASYSEGMRAPTPVELSCADPAQPCALPNAFASDPYLKKVVSRTLELGARGKLSGGWRWSAAAFQTRLQDDILFTTSNAFNLGYFQNVGDTQRRGLELGLERQQGGWDWGVHYTRLDATFQTGFEEQVSANSAADANGVVHVLPGARIPGIPAHLLKAQARYSAGQRWSVGLAAQLQSQTYARGDEVNRDRNGTVPGYAIVNLDGRYALLPALDLALHVRNLFDRGYSTYGQVGTNYFNQPGQAFDLSGAGTPTQFRSAGAPRAGWVTLTWWFDQPPAGAVAGAPDRD